MSTPGTPLTPTSVASPSELETDETILKSEEFIYKSDFESKQKVSGGGNVLINLIKSLKPGMDLTSITCPPFMLKPSSYLEVRGDYFAPMDFMLDLNKENHPLKRIMKITKWMLSTLTITPQTGVGGTKPYNPILGEKFLCTFTHPDGSTTKLISEQVSHHPPISSTYMVNEQNKFSYTNTSGFSVKFQSNKVESSMNGKPIFRLEEIDEDYEMTLPSVLVKNLFLGTTRVEHAGDLIIECKKHDTKTVVTIKSKNDISGGIYMKGKKFFNLSGSLLDQIFLTDEKSNKKGKFVDTKSIVFPTKVVKPIHEQDEMESRRVWHRVSYALKMGDEKTALRYKTAVEEKERRKVKERKVTNTEHQHEFFEETSEVVNDIPIFKIKDEYL